MRANDGTLWGAWSNAFTVTAPIDSGPVETPVNSSISSIQGQSFAASSLFTYSDPFGSAATEYDFWDTGKGGGYFALNGTALGANQNNVITAAQLSQLTYHVGSGTDTLWVEANDGTVWGPWSNSFTISDPSTIGAGATLELASAFSGNVTFAASTGTLQLDSSSSFAGTVAGMCRPGHARPKGHQFRIRSYSDLFRQQFRRHAHCDGRYPQRQYRFVRELFGFKLCHLK